MRRTSEVRRTFTLAPLTPVIPSTSNQPKGGESMAAVSQPKASAPDRRTINVTDLRTETREILENAHFRG